MSKEKIIKILKKFNCSFKEEGDAITLELDFNGEHYKVVHDQFDDELEICTSHWFILNGTRYKSVRPARYASYVGVVEDVLNVLVLNSAK